MTNLNYQLELLQLKGKYSLIDADKLIKKSIAINKKLGDSVALIDLYEKAFGLQNKRYYLYKGLKLNADWAYIHRLNEELAKGNSYKARYYAKKADYEKALIDILNLNLKPKIYSHYIQNIDITNNDAVYKFHKYFCYLSQKNQIIVLPQLEKWSANNSLNLLKLCEALNKAVILNKGLTEKALNISLKYLIKNTEADYIVYDSQIYLYILQGMKTLNMQEIAYNDHIFSIDELKLLHLEAEAIHHHSQATISIENFNKIYPELV
jgi:hypothetical protein